MLIRIFIAAFILIIHANCHLTYSQSDLPTIDGTVIERIAGTPGLGAFSGDGGDATLSRIDTPQDIVVHPDGFLLIADFSNHRVRKIDLETGIISTFAGTGVDASTGNIGFATEADVSFPRSLAIDVFGQVYIGTNNQIRIVDRNGRIDLFAGASTPGDAGDGRNKFEAQLGTIGGMSFDEDGGLIFADIDNHKVRKVRTNDTIVTLVGNGVPGNAGDGSPPFFAQLDTPIDVEVVNPGGVIYIAERIGNRIRRIRDGIITTVFDRSDGLQTPRGLALFNDIFLYISDGNHIVQRLNLFDGTAELVAGTGIPGFEGDGGLASAARINSPIGMDTDVDGDLYFVESANHVVRFVSIPGSNVVPTPRPTATQTPTPTATSTPTPIPTSTPRQIQPTATQTPFLTATPTSTPTGLPRGQLAPAIPRGESFVPGFVFHSTPDEGTDIIVTAPVDSNRVKVVLSSTVDGQNDLSFDDTIELNIRRPDGSFRERTISIGDGFSIPPEDITDLFLEGRNTVFASFIDSKSDGFFTASVFIVVFSAPVLRDVPDIRGLVDERITSVYRIEDFISDIDTPIEDVTVTVQTTGRLNLLWEPGIPLTVEPADRPGDATFQITATDGIFSVSEDVHVKRSSFIYDQFQLDPAPLMDDFAFLAPDNINNFLIPFGVNVSDVPVETTFAANSGLTAAHVARGSVFLFPEFPGRKVTAPIDVALVGQRDTNLDDYDGMLVTTSSVFSPGDGEADRNLNFNSPSLDETNWFQLPSISNPIGTITIDEIPRDPVPVITDGRGLLFEVDPGEVTHLASDFISLPPGPAVISLWLAVENLGFDDSDFPIVRLAMGESGNDITISEIKGSEIKGKSEYQFLSIVYDVQDTDVQAHIVLDGVQQSGRVQMYVDNLRIYPMKRDIDRALGLTDLPVEFDGSFESVIEGLGDFFRIEESFSEGSFIDLTQEVNRTETPIGLRKSLIMDLLTPRATGLVEIGPNFIDEDFYPRFLSARAYINEVEEGDSIFAIQLDNGEHTVTTILSSDRLVSDPDTWHEITATGYFSQPGLFDPIIRLQNATLDQFIPNIFTEGATIAVDDISLEAFQDTRFFWDHKKLPKLK